MREAKGLLSTLSLGGTLSQLLVFIFFLLVLKLFVSAKLFGGSLAVSSCA